jgi:chloride channel protein, CIC family
MMNQKVERVEDRLADFTSDRRVLILSLMALVIGALSAVVAYVLVWLIAVITNIVFYQRFSAVFQSPEHHHLGYWVIVVPAIGGIVIGLMARFGSEKIRGHGIPEALEAILFGRSRMSPKVAVLKPLSSAISIGTGGRRCWFTLCPTLPSFFGGAENTTRCWRSRRYGGHI